LVSFSDQYIAATPSIHTIIMAANWPLYFNGFEKVGQGHISAEQFKTAFEARVARYQGLGKRVIVFLAPPTGVSPRACVVRPMRLTEKANCIMARKDAMVHDGQYRAYFNSFLSLKGITTFDPFTYMCDNTNCKVTDGTRIYYVDHEHFSIFGGQFLANAAKDDLQNLLGKPIK
jgi:hypothetical protein